MEASAFAKHSLKDVKIDGGEPLRPIHLTAGGAGPSAEEMALEPGLQTAGVELRSGVADEQAERLPLPGRDPLYLLETLPGLGKTAALRSANGESVSRGNIRMRA